MAGSAAFSRTDKNRKTKQISETYKKGKIVDHPEKLWN
jgi:hypothetical protein